jgi:hypothetical protein
MATSFSVNFDYRCPFARNAHEHLLTALEAGADFDVSFKAFSLDQPHAREGGPTVWEDPRKRQEQAAVAAGIVVRDRFPDKFLAAHASLFSIRHDEGADLRDPAVIRTALDRAGVDAEAVFKELEDGWPYEVCRAEHEESVAKFAVFGVPTFIIGDDAVFVRLMNRPKGDAKVALETINEVVDLLVNRPEINEYKHTQLRQ